MSASVHAPGLVDYGRLEAELRQGLLRPRAPKRLLVHVTRAQVHQLFPRLRDRFPLEVEVVAPSGRERHDLRNHVEIWPVSLEARP